MLEHLAKLKEIYEPSEGFHSTITSFLEENPRFIDFAELEYACHSERTRLCREISSLTKLLEEEPGNPLFERQLRAKREAISETITPLTEMIAFYAFRRTA